MCHNRRIFEEGDIGQSSTSSVLTTWVTRNTKEMRVITKQGTLLLIWTLVLLQEVQSFNIAVDRSLLLRGDKKSYFGFSLTLHKNTNGKRLSIAQNILILSFDKLPIILRSKLINGQQTILHAYGTSAPIECNSHNKSTYNTNKKNNLKQNHPN